MTVSCCRCSPTCITSSRSRWRRIIPPDATGCRAFPSSSNSCSNVSPMRRGVAIKLSPLLIERRGPRLDQRAQREQRRGVGNAVHPRRAEMALERRNHDAGVVVIAAGFRDAVAVGGERPLQPRHWLAAVAGLERLAFETERGGAHPMADAGLAQELPREFLARILLARRRHVRMRQYAIGADRAAPRYDALA